MAKSLGTKWISSLQRVGRFKFEPCTIASEPDHEYLLRNHLTFSPKLPALHLPTHTSFERLESDLQPHTFPHYPNAKLHWENTQHLSSKIHESDFKVVATSHALLALAGFSKYHWKVKVSIRPQIAFLDLHLSGEKRFRDANSIGQRYKRCWGSEPVFSIHQSQLGKFSLFIGSETDGEYRDGDCSIRVSQSTPERVILPRKDWGVSRLQMTAILENIRYFGFGQYKEEDLEIVINRSDVIEAEIEEWVEDAEDAFERLLAHLTKLEGMLQGDYHMFGSKRSLEKIYATCSLEA